MQMKKSVFYYLRWLGKQHHRIIAEFGSHEQDKRRGQESNTQGRTAEEKDD